MLRVVVHVFDGMADVATEPDGVECEIIDFDAIQDEHGLTKTQVYELMGQMMDGYDPDALAAVLERDGLAQEELDALS